MRPERQDIAVPPFQPVEWIGTDPPDVYRICARGPLLVHFIDVAHHSSVRTLPYHAAWHDRYADAGLTVLAVNSPRFAFTGDPAKLAAAVDRLRLPFGVACDPEHAIWRDYGCEGWPSLFLWGQGGALRWFQFGEGEYQATERAIHEELAAVDPTFHAPSPMDPVRPSDAPGARVVVPTDEVIVDDHDAPVTVDYEGGAAYASVDGSGSLEVRLDGSEQALQVTAPGVYELAAHEHHEPHRLAVRPSEGVALHAVSFGAGVP